MTNSKQAVTQYTLTAQNTPGQLAKASQVFAKEGINIECLMTESFGDVCTFKFLCDKNNIRRKFEAAGFQVIETQVLCLELPNRPGELNRVCKTLAEEQIDIRNAYGSSRGPVLTLVLNVDQTEKAATLLKEYGAGLLAAAR